MTKTRRLVLGILILTGAAFGQSTKTKQGHTNHNKFKQLKELLEQY